jgi:hypothetical protein
MKNLFSLLAGVAILAMLSVTGCAQKAGTSGDALYKRIPGKEHKTMYPDGHRGSTSGCYYVEKDDVYFCSH